MASARCVYCDAVLQPNSAYCLDCGQIIPQAQGERSVATAAGSVAAGAVVDAVPGVVMGVPLPGTLPWQRHSAADHQQVAAPAPSFTEALLSFDDGVTVRVTGKAVLGRRPGDTALALGARPVEINDTTRSISRVHLLFEIADGKLIVADLGSANGSRVQRGTMVRALEPGGRAVEILSGDLVWIGDVRMTVLAH